MFEQFLATYEASKSVENEQKVIKDLLKESFAKEDIESKREHGYIFKQKKNVRYNYTKQANEVLAPYGVLEYLVSFTKKQVKELELEDYVIVKDEKSFGFTAKHSKVNVVKPDVFMEEYKDLSQEELLERLKVGKANSVRLKEELERLKMICREESNQENVSFDWGTFRWKEETELDLKRVAQDKPEALLEGKISRTELTQALDELRFEDNFGDDYDDVVEQLETMLEETVGETSVVIISEEDFATQMQMLS